MIVAALVMDLVFPDARSLKDKRRRLSGLMARIRAGYPVSVTEAAHQDLWQRGVIGVALATTDARLAQSMFDRIIDSVGGDGEIELVSHGIEFFQPEGVEI